jgi:surface polysaccharide O-acyltransferase-like enzyme
MFGQSLQDDKSNLLLNSDNNSKRNAGIDVLKIICMFFVIWFHYSDHGTTVITANDTISINWCILSFSRIFGGICNCIFVLITGYFQYEKKFNLIRILKLWLEVLFYSVLCGTIAFLIRIEPFSIKSLIKMIFPISFNQYWYFSTYIILMLFSPFINLLIERMNKKQHQFLILYCFLIYSLFPTLRIFTWVNIEVFFFLYIVAAYIKKYEVASLINTKKLFFLCIMFILLEIVSIFVVRMINYYFNKNAPLDYFIWGMSKFPCVITSLSIFLFFTKIKIKSNRIILFISSSVFSVYLIHIGRLWPLFFRKLFNNKAYFSTNRMIVQLLICSITIFVGSILIDKIRIIIFEKPVLKVIKRSLTQFST